MCNPGIQVPYYLGGGRLVWAILFESGANFGKDYRQDAFVCATARALMMGRPFSPDAPGAQQPRRSPAIDVSPRW